MSVVKPSLCILIFGFAIPGLSAFVEWNSLKATWCPPNVDNTNCFQDIPRTVESALKNGWRKIEGSTCRNGGKFFGYRMVKGNDYAVTPLYDEKGIIAGVQVNALKSELFATKNPYKFDEVPDYLDNTIEGHPIYSTTAYFVNPTHICTNGRSLHQLEIEGTASRIYFQTGWNPSHLRMVPLYRDMAAKNYTSTNCVPSMGHHNYYNVPKMQLSNCTTIIPSFLLFNNNGELHGFGQTTVGKLSSHSFEHPNKVAVRVGLDPITPQCMLNMAESPDSPGYSNIHFFLTDSPKTIKCTPIVQTRALHDSITINPNVFKKH
ncbi:uncharacterized protein LOC119076283 isoform X1 [Bradysia coprophila]|uniref:uncharacterized protein LOC119076283 isoform X1 n=1 Tax=Bradysia coprophila TaxID=38358 RepID=UPI00187D88BF|nr:uncharacterized protein LOC119076283 isoform X1 [Bradysia coprophila]